MPAAENNDGLCSLTVGQMPGLALSTSQESVQSPHPISPLGGRQHYPWASQVAQE